MTNRGGTPHLHEVSAGLEPVTVNNLEQSRRGFMKSLEPLLFADDDDTDDGRYFSEVLSAVQRWFCCSGWPNSINLITIPDSLRRYMWGGERVLAILVGNTVVV